MSTRQLGLLWGGVSLLCLLLSPWASQLATGVAACPVKVLSGVPCPSCGTTRAAVALARFEMAEAFRSYPLQSAAWVGFLVAGFLAGIWTISGRQLPSLPRRLPPWALAGLVSTLAANWIYCILTGV